MVEVGEQDPANPSSPWAERAYCRVCALRRKATEDGYSFGLVQCRECEAVIVVIDGIELGSRQPHNRRCITADKELRSWKQQSTRPSTMCCPLSGSSYN